MNRSRARLHALAWTALGLTALNLGWVAATAPSAWGFDGVQVVGMVISWVGAGICFWQLTRWALRELDGRIAAWSCGVGVAIMAKGLMYTGMLPDTPSLRIASSVVMFASLLLLIRRENRPMGIRDGKSPA